MRNVQVAIVSSLFTATVILTVLLFVERDKKRRLSDWQVKRWDVDSMEELFQTRPRTPALPAELTEDIEGWHYLWTHHTGQSLTRLVSLLPFESVEDIPIDLRKQVVVRLSLFRAQIDLLEAEEDDLTRRLIAEIDATGRTPRRAGGVNVSRPDVSRAVTTKDGRKYKFPASQFPEWTEFEELKKEARHALLCDVYLLGKAYSETTQSSR